MALTFLSFFWGLGEATLFFIIPDVLLTRIAITNQRKAFRLSIGALFGAIVGGAFMYEWGRHDPTKALAVLNHIPGISLEMIENVLLQINRVGLWAVFIGPAKAIPYKIYAVQMAVVGENFILFLLLSLPARWLRFALGIMVTNFLATMVFEKQGGQWVQKLHALFWLLFYVVYFSMNRS